ncbi:lasso peptide biosynthesis B2 protein [Pseudorhodoplanes sp.]|jgi:hypothetical protein|uniref:lasso peptide biosynthesis B2 protein n=1 Tax=Pseudorhodoplanes sp. TaxID=1934341 RepID=UPI002B5FD4EA|nr:lasso peptide biosynthesis B2 protein [Pseudorhodoplanes sp.]HWV42894.1 lasso peptide biosynthesis B2 protein [Pseudorhodoplanes sp.]
MTPRTMRRIYLREAVIMLILARLAVRLLPPARIFGWCNRPLARVRRFAADDTAWIAWGIERASRLPGMTTSCLPRALAAHAMLRRRAIPSRLCLGVARAQENVTAHAWVESGQRMVIGGEDAKDFTLLSAFGSGLT